MDFFVHICIAQSFFGGLVLFLKKPKHISNRILGVWLLCNGLLMTGEMIEEPVVNFFKPGLFPLLLTFGPFLYLYLISVTTENPRWKRTYLLHFIPFLLVVIHRSLTDPISMGDEVYDSENPAVIANQIYLIMVVISLIVYWIISIVKLSRHKKNIENVFSYQSPKITLNWLRFVVFLFFIIYILGFITPYWLTILKLNFLSNIDTLVLSFTFFAFSASLFGLNQPIIYENFRNVQRVEGKVEIETKEEKKYQKSGLSEFERDEIKQRIIHHLQEEKPYLNPEYSINMLASEINISRHHATEVINSSLNKNFYTLINELRTEEVISRMNSSQFSNYTILAVAYDSGFNSKSAFNRIFKQATGKTPSEYKLYSTT